MLKDYPIRYNMALVHHLTSFLDTFFICCWRLLILTKIMVNLDKFRIGRLQGGFRYADIFSNYDTTVTIRKLSKISKMKYRSLPVLPFSSCRSRWSPHTSAPCRTRPSGCQPFKTFASIRTKACIKASKPLFE